MCEKTVKHVECDLHTHSFYSFDGHDSVDDLCRAAIAAGLHAIAITDHCDIDGIHDGYYTPYDAGSARAAIAAAKEKYGAQLQILWGVELGQPYVYPEESRKLLRENPFDFVIGSLHNLVGVPDFYYIDAAKIPERQAFDLFVRALDETERLLLSFDGIDTVAHLTYPLRYFRRAGRSLDLSEAEGALRRVFRRMVERDVALEVNSSGFRHGIGMTLPEAPLVSMYLQEGGKCVTVGSDAHFAADVGNGIAQAIAQLRALGVPELLTFRCGKKCRVPIAEIER